MPMLLSLPYELRALIWNHVFIIPEPAVQLQLSPHAARHRSVLRVLTVCTTIYQEAVHIFYRHNNLLLSSTAALFRFLATLHRLRRAEITSLVVANYGLHYSSCQCASKAFSMLLLCPSLTSFQLDLTTEYSWDILDEVPQHAERFRWDLFQSGLDCLANLRGLKSASIRGIHPRSAWPDECGFGLDDLEEVHCPKAEELENAWLRPLGPRTSQVKTKSLQRSTTAKRKSVCELIAVEDRPWLESKPPWVQNKIWINFRKGFIQHIDRPKLVPRSRTPLPHVPHNII